MARIQCQALKLFTVFIIFLAGCTIGKVGRVEKRKAKRFKDNPVELFVTYTNEALATSFIKIRRNGTFHLEETVWGFSDHYFGEWTKKNDTIILSYSNNNHKSKCIESLVLDRTQGRVKVISNKTECDFEWYWKINFLSKEF